MTNKEILKLAILKVVGNGYLIDKEYKTYPTTDHYFDKYIELKQYYSLIFSKDFAKAFWQVMCNSCHGEKQGTLWECGRCDTTGYTSNWKWHLQQMVLEEEPLKYIAKFLDNEE